MNSTKSGIAGILLLVVGVLLFFVVLNYFNILSISRIYPNLFGSLPQQKSDVKESKPSNKITFSCPVPRELCGSGKEIYDGSLFLGIGYNLPISSKIYAVISGRGVFGGAEDKKRNVLSHSKIVIGGIGGTQGYVITYEYFGLPKGKTETKDIMDKEELGAVWGGNFPKDTIFKGINLLISIKTNTGQDIHMSKFE